MATSPVIEKMLDENPLTVFSIYTDIQARTVRTFGEEILTCLQNGITPQADGNTGVVCQGSTAIRAHGLFWLWVLGAYEVVRTMCEAEQCFSPTAAARLKDLKRSLAIVRIPFAKQELRGKNTPVHAELSISGIRHSPPDILYQIEGQMVSTRDLIERFSTVIASIRRPDVIADHRTTYQ